MLKTRFSSYLMIEPCDILISQYNNLSFRKAKLAYLLPKLKMREWTQWPTAPPMRDADLNSKMENSNLSNLKLSDKDHIQKQQDVKHVFTQVY